MRYMGNYQVLAHIETSEFSMRFLYLEEEGHVAPHYHNESKQLYAVLEGVVEVTLGDRTLHLRPYASTHIEKQIVHNVRAVNGRAFVVAICTPPLKLEDQHPVEQTTICLAGRRARRSATAQARAA